MDISEFAKQRRQIFLDMSYYLENYPSFEKSILKFQSTPAGTGRTQQECWLHSKMYVASDAWDRFNFGYTAGHPILALRDELETVIRAIEVYTDALRDWHGNPHYPPFMLDELDHYQQLMQLIGLCYLLHRQDLLPRLAALQDGYFAGEDVLYEDFLTFGLNNRFAAETLHFFKAYTDLHDALYAEEEGKAQAEAHLLQYIKRWYKTSMKGLPWHNAHLEPNQAGYYGYWSFEAGAVAFLQSLDDHALRDFPYYPMHMVDWARQFNPDSHISQQGRCPAGQPCPQAGSWWTPAKADARRAFAVGDIMPDYPDSSYGTTIWYREAE